MGSFILSSDTLTVGATSSSTERPDTAGPVRPTTQSRVGETTVIGLLSQNRYINLECCTHVSRDPKWNPEAK
jgi:hypothetical protein